MAFSPLFLYPKFMTVNFRETTVRWILAAVLPEGPQFTAR